MDIDALIKKFEKELTIQEERLKKNTEEINDLCAALNLDASTITVEQVEELLTNQQTIQKEKEDKLQKLIDDYEKLKSE